MRELPLSVLVAASLLGGCLGAGDGPPGTTPPAAPADGLLPDGAPAPAWMDWGDCDVHAAMFPAPMDELRPFLAEGLEPVAYTEAAGAPAPAPGALGAWAVSGHRCAGLADLWIYILVTAAPEISGDATFFNVPVRVLTNNATLARIWQAWKLEVEHQADVTLELDAPAPLTRGRTASPSSEPPMALSTTGTGSTTAAGFAVRTFVVEHGAIVSLIDWDVRGHLVSDLGPASFEGAPSFSAVEPRAGGMGLNRWGAPYRIAHVDPAAMRGEGS